MARIDRYIALALLAFSIGYGYLAWTHPLLPFEARMPFKPNTLPIGLAGLGVLFSSLIILLPKMDDLSKDAEGYRGFAWGQALILVAMMVAYALLLRPLGFIASTTLFIVSAAWLLGETHHGRSLTIGLIASGLIWYLVDNLLGIYLVALPAFLAELL